MLHSKNMPKFLWGEAVNTAVYVLNRTPTSRDPTATSYELWTGRKPSVSHLRVFGEDAFVHVPKQFRRKLNPKSKKVTFVAYQGDSKNYRLYDPISGKIIRSRDVNFRGRAQENLSSDSRFISLELPLPAEDDVNGLVARDGGNEENLENEPERLDVEAEVPAVPEQRREDQQAVASTGRQLRDRTTLRPPDRYEANYIEYEEPKTLQDAVSGVHSDKWKQAIEEELQAHEKNQTWSIVSRPQDRQLIDSKWVFKVQPTKSGQANRFKARLCARGFRQQYGIDYEETFSPVVRYDSLRVLLAMATQEDLEMLQFDVKTAFLYGKLEENIYMKIPEGLSVSSGVSDPVCKLNKSLYGLKQSSRCWNKTFTMFLSKHGFKMCDSENSVYVGRVCDERVYLILFVDDGLILAKTKIVLDSVISVLRSEFEITVNEPDVFVGVQIERNREEKSMFLCQSNYALRVLIRFNMTEGKSVCTPADTSLDLRVDESSLLDNEKFPFRELVGSLMFLATVTRPDLAFSVNLVSRFLSSYNSSHWEAAKRILRYLRGTCHLGIRYKQNETGLELLGFCDSDFAGDVNTRRSTSGFLFQLSSGPVSWCSQRPKIVTLSTTEAEYVAACAAAKETIWLRRLLKDIECPCVGSTILSIDNGSALRLVKNPEYHKRTKHIDIQYHFIREKYVSGEIDVRQVSSETQLADLFTKPLPRDTFQRLSRQIGLEAVDF